MKKGSKQQQKQQPNKPEHLQSAQDAENPPKVVLEISRSLTMPYGKLLFIFCNILECVSECSDLNRSQR